jgi:hypothetical protein
MTKSASKTLLSAGFAILLAFGCSGERTVYIVVSGGAPAGGTAGAPSMSGDGVSSPTSPSGGSSSGGVAGVAGVAGAGALGGTENVAGNQNSSGGEPLFGGAPASAGESMGGASSMGGVGETAGADGAAGSPGEAGAGCGTLIPDVPADCHATIACKPGSVVDQSNAPTPSNHCYLGTCNELGTPSTALAPAGTACNAAGGAIVCDGAGKCVPCMKTSDCSGGLVCSDAHVCVSGACTDVDCGGPCPACAVGKKCEADADCLSFACDVDSHTCVTPQCQDHHQDGVETDADCGGDVCPACPLNKGCVVNSDCASRACHAYTLTCVTTTCIDAHLDGYETDIDCGGGGCSACEVGRKCKVNFDCVSGHFCNNSYVCQ